jgi:hypothetical protein
MKIKELLEGRHGYDDSGMSLSPGNDEGPDSWDYSAAHDRIGAGDPRPHRTRQYQVDVPHDVHIDGRKWKTFGSKSHAENVARKLAANGKKVHVVRSLEETATAGAISTGSLGGTLENPAAVTLGKAKGKKSFIGSPGKSGTKAPPQPKVVQPKKKDGTAVNGLDMKGKNIFGQAKGAAVIKRR